jgi:hypothetical protein
MFWKCTGSITYVVPVVIAVIPMAGILILLYAATADKYVATFSVILLASGNQFISQACNQYADLWLAFFALFPLVLLEKTRSEPPGNTHIHYFTGFIAATMIWIKNEGMVIFLLTILYLLWNFRKNPAQMSKLLAGTLPLIATYVVFKIYLAPPGDLFRGSLPDTLRKIVNPERFFIIAVYLSKVIVFQFPLLLLILLFFITSGAKTPSTIIIPVLTFTAYFAIYLITPYDVEWHLRTSLDRLIMQIYPTMIFLFSMTLSKYINSSGAMKIADQVTKPI